MRVPIPKMSASVLRDLFSSKGLFKFLSLFSNNTLDGFSLFTVDVAPCVGSSVVVRLLASIVPALRR